MVNICTSLLSTCVCKIWLKIASGYRNFGQKALGVIFMGHFVGFTGTFVELFNIAFVFRLLKLFFSSSQLVGCEDCLCYDLSFV